MAEIKALNPAQDNLERELSELFEKERIPSAERAIGNVVKDITTHHIKPTEEKLPVTAEEAVMRTTSEVVIGERSMAEILRAIDKDELNQDIYSAAVSTNVDALISRLHHRANMLRIRAEELDEAAGVLSAARDKHIEKVSNFHGMISETEDVLRKLAHIEPQKHRG